MFFLGDFYNVIKAELDFATKYTAGQLKFADNPNVLKGFQHQVEVCNAGCLNEDFAAATYEDGHGRGRTLSDAVLRHRGDRGRLPRQCR